MATLKSTSDAFSYKSALMFGLLLMSSVLFAFLIANNGVMMGVLLTAIFIGIPILVKTVADVQFGLYVLVWYSYFLFLIGRLLLPVRLPMGLGMEVLEIALLVGVLVAEFKREKIDWTHFQNPITYIFLVLEVYNVLQFFNPNAVSLAGWLISTRGIVFDLVSYFVIIKIFTSLDIIKKFTKLWLFFALLAALYGFYQEIFGYQDFEWRDINSTPGTIYLIQNWGILRKFSFLSDVAAFGILMAICGIFCSVLALGPYHWSIRVVLIVSALLMFVAMSFSGTRTATAIVPVGFMMYAIMNINKKSTLIMVLIFAMGFIVILYGPFYGGVITRIRTTFQPSTDASMNVREYNRKRIQPYIHTHPIGGGVNTTDSEGEALSPGHPLAGFATDSGYLKTALTIGWVGLIIQMSLYFMIIATGIKNFYRARDSEIRALYAAYICLFFALLIANYAQSAMGQKPIGLIVFSIYAIMPNMIKFDKAVTAK
jgi:putative inorganic carbon (hco3(-)) transporter